MTRAGQKQGKRGKERKTKGETRHKPYNRLTSHAHKSPTVNAKPQPIQTHIRTPKRAKNPLKMRNKAIFKCNTRQAKQERGQRQGERDGTHPKRGSRSAPPALGGHHHRPKREPQRKPCNPQTQNIFHFCRFWSPIFPRKHQSTPKNYSLLPLFALIRCPFDLVECRRSPEAGANESLFDI